MSNITYTYVTFAQLQPIFTTNGLHHRDGIPYHAANETENVLLLIEDHNYEYAAYKYRTMSTIILMIFAWILLIVGFTICCCAQCFRDGGKSKRVRGENAANANGIDDDRANPNDPVEICRHYGQDFEAESLPSYTIVSGLPTYDDALDEFRKAGIILSPSMPIVKLFERDSKENQIYNLENGGTTNGGLSSDNSGDNISLSSTCTCGATNSNTITQNNNNTTSTGNFNLQQPQVIELSPEQLASLSQKRLSLQISFNNSVRRTSRPRIDLYRQVNRNNLLRSQRNGCGGVMGVNGGGGGPFDGFPQIHRSSSTISLSNEPNRLLDSHRLQHLQHRGSLC